jgi:hypothetical protein
MSKELPKVTILVASKGYGIPEIRKQIGDTFEFVSSEEGVDRVILKLLETSLFNDVRPKCVMAEQAEVRDEIIAVLTKTPPPAAVVLVLFSATEIQKKKWKGLGFDIRELKPFPVSKEKDSGEAFTLARLIVSGDAKGSFVMWKNMEQRHASIDATIPALWWQLKKSYGFVKGEEKKKILALMKSVVEMVHESRRGISSLSELFERTVLGLRK